MRCALWYLWMDAANERTRVATKESASTNVTGGTKGNARMTQPRRFHRSGARVSEGLDQLASFNGAKGQSMSIKLTDTQFAMLSDAGRREDRCLVASPSLKGGARLKVADKLISTRFVTEIKAKVGAPIWRRNNEIV